MVCFHSLGIVTFPTGLRLRFCLRTRVNLHALERLRTLQIHTRWSRRHSCVSHRDEAPSHNTLIRPRATHAHILQLGDYLAK